MAADESRWESRLGRERKARREAESIAESATRELYEKQRQLTLLQAVAAAANEAKSIEAAIRFAIDEVCRYCEWPVGHAYIASPTEKHVLIPTDLWHFDPPVERFAALRDATESTLMPVDVGLPGRVLGSGAATWIVDIRRDSNFPRSGLVADLGVRAAFAFPVIVRDEVAAVLEFFADQPLDPMPTLLGLMEHIGTQIGRVIERCQAEEKLQQSELRYRTISELTSDYAYAFRIEDDGRATTEWFAGAVERITGYTRAELEAMGGGFHIVHPDDRPLALQRLQRLLQGEIDTSEFRIVTKSGETRWLHESGRPSVGANGRVVRVYSAAQDVTDRRRAESKTRLLLDLAKDISGTLDLEELLGHVAKRTVAMLPCDGVAVYYWDPTAEHFRLIQHEGIPDSLVPLAEGLTFPAGAPFEGRVMLGELLVIDEMSQQTWLPQALYETFSIQSLVAVPLRLADRHLGSLIAWSTQRAAAFGQPQLELCAGIGQQVAIAAGAAEHYREKQEQAQISGAIARVGQSLMTERDSEALLTKFCRLTCEELGCDSSYTYLLDPEKQSFVLASGYGKSADELEALGVLDVPHGLVENLILQLGRDGLAQVVMSQPQDLVPAALPMSFGIRAAMYVPLLHDGKLIGIHSACRQSGEQHFSPVHESIAKRMSEIGSLALENTRLVEQLERADRLKSEFVATMSHELRTPLNIILGYLELLLEEVFGPLVLEQQDTLVRTQRSAQHLLELIEATLDVSRLESGRMTMRLENVKVAELIQEIEATTRKFWCKPGVELTWPLAHELPVIRTDPVKLRVILRNLIDNALKFTEEGEVRVSAKARVDGVEFSVVDTGIGMVAEALPIIFEPFRQVDGSDSRRYGGTGLGLYTVRLMLQVLGGTVEVESDQGRGSHFRIWVPDLGGEVVVTAPEGSSAQESTTPIHVRPEECGIQPDNITPRYESGIPERKRDPDPDCTPDVGCTENRRPPRRRSTRVIDSNSRESARCRR